MDELETGNGGADHHAGEMLTGVDLDEITKERESGLAGGCSMVQLRQSVEGNNLYAD